MSVTVVITTGGTISSIVSPGTGYTPKLDGSALLGLGDCAADSGKSFEVLEFCNILSQDMTPVQMLELARLIKLQIERPEVDGVIVTHGTVAMEETAFLCDLLLPNIKPIVFTGAMRPSNLEDSDVGNNIRDSAIVARSASAGRLGVVVCMDKTVHSARWVRKMYTDTVDTFQSPNGGILGVVANNAFNLTYGGELPAYQLPVFALERNVHFLSVVAGMKAPLEILQNDGRLRGLVVEGFPGTGAVTPALAEVFPALIKKGVVIVLGSRSPYGRVRPSSGGVAGSYTLQEMGVILGGYLSGPKLYLLLMAALSTDHPQLHLQTVIDQCAPA